MKFLIINCPLEAHLKKVSCVYRLSVGRQFYIGQTKDLRKRILSHLTSVSKGKICNIPVPFIYKAKVIHFTIIEYVEGEVNLKNRELFYLRLYAKNKLFINAKTNRFKHSIAIK